MTGRDDLTKRLEACYTGAVHDVMRARGCKDFVLPPEIRPLVPARSVAGPAFTLRGHWAPGTDAHETLLAWTGMLSQAPAGHVVVCQANDSTVAHMGELSAETLQARGVRGYVVDGGCRDVAFIARIGFPVWCRYLTPRPGDLHWQPQPRVRDIGPQASPDAQDDLAAARGARHPRRVADQDGQGARRLTG